MLGRTLDDGVQGLIRYIQQIGEKNHAQHSVHTVTSTLTVDIPDRSEGFMDEISPQLGKFEKHTIHHPPIIAMNY